MSGSLAIFTTAAHLFFDIISFVINMYSMKIAKRKPNHKSSYGYHRAEVIGALGSIIMIWLMAIWLI
jgi:zinc transporter 2